jgi:hypothetical protein
MPLCSKFKKSTYSNPMDLQVNYCVYMSTMYNDLFAWSNVIMNESSELDQYNEANTPNLLIPAVVDNNMAQVILLLNHEDPNGATEDGRTALHEATLNLNPAMIEVLVMHGALNFDARDNDGLSALDHIGAAYDGEDETPLLPVLNRLLQHGANPSLNPDIDAVNQALFWAAFKGFTQIVIALLRHGADPRGTTLDFGCVSDEASEGGHAVLARFLALIEQVDSSVSLGEVLQRYDAEINALLIRSARATTVAPTGQNAFHNNGSDSNDPSTNNGDANRHSY